jgi:hypothetical protein
VRHNNNKEERDLSTAAHRRGVIGDGGGGGSQSPPRCFDSLGPAHDDGGCVRGHGTGGTSENRGGARRGGLPEWTTGQW